MRQFDQDDFNKIEALVNICLQLDLRKVGIDEEPFKEEVNEWLEDLRTNFHVK